MISRLVRRGFSLLEVMIATAILAGSAMVLLSLISLGTRFGSKAEVRIGALVQAQSILDESILRIYSGESIENYTGVLPGIKPRSYRVTVEPFLLSDPTSMGDMGQDPNAMGGMNQSLSGGFSTPFGGAPGIAVSPNALGTGAAPAGPQPSELVSVKVELYESEGAAVAGPSSVASASSGGSKALIELTRIVRRVPLADPSGVSSIPATGLPIP